MVSRSVRVSIGNVRLGARPRVVLAVPGFHPSLVRMVRQGVDLLEFRVDRFRRLDQAAVAREMRALRRLGLPIIGTVRRRAEGGAARLSEAQRTALYAAIAPLVDAMDVELRSARVRERVLRLARRHRIPVILSYHDVRATPSDATLERIIQQAGRLGARIIKVATLARTDEDIVRLLALTVRHRRRGVVTIAMGSRGAVSRVVFPLLGSLLTYTSPIPSDGQWPLPRLVRELSRYSARRRTPR